MITDISKRVQASHVLAFFLVVLTLARLQPAFAQDDDVSKRDPLILSDVQGKYPLGSHLEILEDPSGELTIENVASPEFDSRFAPSQVEIPNYGYTDSAYWVRLRLHNETRLTNHWLLEVGFANMQYVDLYTPLPDGHGYEVKQTGSLRAPETRDIRHPRIILNVMIPTQSQQSYYLRFQNGGSMTLPLTLWTPNAFLMETQLNQALHGLYFGALIILFFYNLFLLFSLRETAYLYLVIILASMVFFEATYAGYAEIYLIPNLYYLKPTYLPLSFSLIIVSILLFSNSFLEVKTRLPKLHRVNIAILGVWGVLMILTPFTSYHNLVILMVSWALTSLVAVLAAGIISWRRGFRPARFFMFAWFGLVIAIFITILVRLGFVPSTIFTESAYRLGVTWMAVCWSIELADRINLLKAETEGTNRDLRNSEHRLSQILEGLPLGVVVYGKDNKPNFVNRRVTEILSNPAQGIRPDLSAGRTLAQALKYYSFHVTGSSQEYPLDDFPVYRALQGEPASVDDAEADLVDRRVPLEIWASPVRDDAGGVESAVVAFQDITQRKRADVELDVYRKHIELLVEKRTAELSTSNERLHHEIIERETLEQLLYQHIEWLTTLNQVRQTIGGAADLPQAYDTLSATILQLLDARAVFLLPG